MNYKKFLIALNFSSATVTIYLDMPILEAQLLLSNYSDTRKSLIETGKLELRPYESVIYEIQLR